MLLSSICRTIRLTSGLNGFIPRVSSPGLPLLQQTSSRTLHQKPTKVKSIVQDEAPTFKDDSVITSDFLKLHEKEFPEPRATLNNIMAVVNNETKAAGKTMLMSYRSTPNGSWNCTCHLRWPSSSAFSAVAKSKSMAAKLASLKALQWLSKEGKIKDNRPILIEKGKLKKVDIEIMLDANDQAKIDRITNVYDQEIKGLIKEAVDNLESLKPFEDVEPLELLNVNNESRRVRLMNSRNKFLQAKARHLREDVRMADIIEKQEQLPISKYRKEILESIATNRVTVIKGEPGCGKSTQVPQYIMDDAALRGEGCNCNIIVTQPRRISAIALAERVADERAEEVGEVVGYQVRFKSRLPRAPVGTIKFCSSGILLRILQSNPTLEGVSHVLLDEAHERDVNTDMLMLLLKRMLTVNPNIKLVVMSATINPELFLHYYPNAAALSIPGFTYPVKSYFLEHIPKVPLLQTRSNQDHELPRLYHDEIADLIQWINNNKPEGAILCFLPGWQDIKQVAKQLERRLNSNSCFVIPLHSRLGFEEQNLVFRRPPPGSRKIILSTNVAETSVTIDDVGYVVDTGVHKEERLAADKGTAILDNNWISQANVSQRRGRAGRVKPGESYHLYSTTKYQSLPLFPVPELHRVPLQKVVLDIKSYNEQEKAAEFLSGMPEPPSEGTVLHAVRELQELGALTEDESLTLLGRRISKFSTHPKLSKTLVHAAIFRCLDPILTITSILAADADMFSNSLDERAAIVHTKKKYSQFSDHLAVLHLYNEWREMYENRDFSNEERFCISNMLRGNTMRLISRLRYLALEQLSESKMVKKELSEDVGKEDLPISGEFLKAVLYSGVSSHLFLRSWDVQKNRIKLNSPSFITESGSKASLASDSVCQKKQKLPSDLLVYFKKQESAIRRTTVVRDASSITPLAVAIFSPATSKISIDGEMAVLASKHRSPYRILAEESDAGSILKLRTIVNDIIKYYLLCEGRTEGESHEVINDFRQELVILLSDLFKKALHHSHQSDPRLPAG